MDFIAIDVETANADMASICQIGIAKFSENKMVDEWVSLVDPEDYFDSINISIHGIDKSQVKGAPTLLEVSEKLIEFFSNTVVVSHTHFDRVSISRAFNKYRISLPEISWLDSARVARRTWPEFSQRGYGLKNVANHIGYDFRHHDALEDAKASGHIMLEAMKLSRLDILAWTNRVKKPIDLNAASVRNEIKREGNPEGWLSEEVAVFTGALLMQRKEAADLAAKMGCKVNPRVTKETTLLIVGDQDVSKLSGKDKSSKHLKAEDLIGKGQSIRIIKESDFVDLIKHMD